MDHAEDCGRVDLFPIKQCGVVWYGVACLALEDSERNGGDQMGDVCVCVWVNQCVERQWRKKTTGRDRLRCFQNKDEAEYRIELLE